jgi:hypothetical protein
LVKHRDGIVGTWQPGVAMPAVLGLDDPLNLKRWEPWVRASIFDFELLSHLHFTTQTAANPTTPALWHIESAPGATPTATLKPLVRYDRPTDAVFRAQLDLVEAYADLREDRASEILAQLGPPTAFWSTVLYLHPDRTRYTLELLETALRLANFAEMRLKQGLSCRRPIDYSPQIQPMILTPGHGALPSGHATEAFMIAYILWRLRRQHDAATDGRWCEQLMRQASRIAINRTIAGVHFPADSIAGQMLGLALGRYFVHRCTGTGTYEEWEFRGLQVQGTDDFNWRLLFDVNNLANDGMPLAALPAYAARISQPTAQQSLHLEWLWDLAVLEWATP